jgi:putative glutamine amidotransferase
VILAPVTSRATPVVGVTTYRERAAWGSWDRDAAVLAAAYVDGVAAGGSWPVLLPPAGDRPPDPATADRLVRGLDGLVVVGGADVDPDRYRSRPHARTAGVDVRRDGHELALLAAADRAGLPLLAICRGMQLLNVARGGTLDQHVPDVVGHDGHQPARGCFADVDVATVPGTVLATVLGASAVVRCSHHQSVAAVGAGLVVAARASDGTVEALEGTGGADRSGPHFTVAVQWHPEEDDRDGRLFAALADAARRRGQARPAVST